MGGEKLKAGRFVLAAVFSALFMFISFPVFAQDRDSSVPAILSEDAIILGEALPANPAGESASVWIVIRMVLILALAALAIYGVVFFIKRLARPPKNRDPYLKVLASVPLGSDSFAAVVSLGSRAWLVGGGSGAGISLIAEVEDQETLETMLLDDARNNADIGNRILDFKAMLNRFGKKNNPVQNRAESPSDMESHIDSIRKQRERLSGLR